MLFIRFTNKSHNIANKDEKSNKNKKNQRKQQKKSNTDSDVKKPQHVLTKSRYSIGNNYNSCLNSKARWLKSDIKADDRAFKKAHATSPS